MSNKMTYRQQFTRCGKQRCRKCKEGPGHGPYWYAYWSENGRTVSKYIGMRLPVEAPQVPVHQESNSIFSFEKLTTNTETSSTNTVLDVPFTDASLTLRVYLLGQFRVERRVEAAPIRSINEMGRGQAVPLQRETQGEKWQIVAGRMWQRRRARALLGCLISSPGRKLGREQAMEALWPDLDIKTAANRLNGAVHELRQILEPENTRPATSSLLRLEHNVLKLADSSAIWVDAESFESLLNKANITSNSVQIEQILEKATALYGGDYLLEELYSGWASARRESLRRSWMGSLLKLAELRAARGAMNSAIELLDRLLTTDPTHETAVRRLMVLLTQLDRRGEALRVYTQLASLLQREYGCEPLPETRELYEALRQGYLQVFSVSGTALSIADENATIINSNNNTAAVQNSALSRPGAVSGNTRQLRQLRQLGRLKQSPLIGREQELETMRELIHATERIIADTSHEEKLARPANAAHAATAGESGGTQGDAQGTINTSSSHFLLLLGEPGIGKTRLAEELSLEANARGWAVAWSRAYEQEGMIPYRLWTEILRALLQDVSTEFLLSHVDPGLFESSKQSPGSMTHSFTSSSKLQRLSVLLPELEVYTELSPSRYRSSLLPEQERLHLWEATSGLLATLSKASPLLIVLDDLHWTDDSSLELLAYLIHHVQEERILFVSTCRDTELTPTSSLYTLIYNLRREQAMTTMAIQPLSKHEIGSLVAHLPDRIVECIQFQAGGNPFFAEELARVSEASLQVLSYAGSEAQFHFANDNELGSSTRTASLPETIASVLDRRLKRLSSNCRTLLGKAAVLGGSFHLSQLLFMEGNQDQNSEDMILDLLDEALHAGILVEEGTGTRIVYSFWHPLIVSHLYDSLSAARRAQFHRRAANALISAHQTAEGNREGKLHQSLAAAITHHLSKGGGDPLQIAQYAELAGNEAAALSAFAEAQGYYRLAIETLSEAGLNAAASDRLRLARLLERSAECSKVEGKFEEVRRLYTQALELRGDLWAALPNDNAVQIQALLWREIGRAWSANGEFERALECYTRGKQVLYEAGVTSGAAWACLHLQEGNLCWAQGNYEMARHYTEEALAILEQAMQNQWGDSSEAHIAYFKKLQTSTPALQTRTARAMLGDPMDVGNAHELLGVIAVSTGQFSVALKHLNSALAIYEQHDLVMMMTQVCGNLGAVHAMKAENIVARTYYRRALELAERIGDLPNMAFVTGNLGDVAARCGDLLEAEEEFKRSLDFAERVNDREHKSWCNVALAAALQDQGNFRGALVCIRRALALGRAIKSTRLTGFALIALGDWRVTAAIALYHKQAFSGANKDFRDYSACNHLLLRAKAALERALALEKLDAEVLTEGQFALANVYFLLGDLETAYTMAIHTLEEGKQHEITRVLARSQRLLGCIQALRGQFEEANAYFEQGMAVFRTYEMRLDYARTLRSYGETLLKRSMPEDTLHNRGLSYVREAYDIFANCKASIDLEWCERILSSSEFTKLVVF